MTVIAVIVMALLAATVVTVTTTPLYKSSTRLFVSTYAGSSLSDIYQGNLLSQERVTSYTTLLMGATLAQRTVDALHLDMSQQELRSEVTARSKPGTILIDVDVLDPSPIRARDIANTLSNQFVLMIRELETPGDNSQPDTRVVVEQHAAIPNTPVVPDLKRNIRLGLVIGVLLGVALAVLRDFLDNTVKTYDDLETVAGVGVVGGIPLDKAHSTASTISFGTENTRISESFRKLRTNLSFLAVDNPPRLIVVTSPAANEGKSMTAINIALALVEADNNVLIVDGDMRRSTIHKYLKVDSAVGLSNVLSGAVPLEDALQDTQFPGLTVLAAGATPPNPSELLASQAAKKLLAELRGKYDYVIVDSTPLLAVTDAALLATNADGALLLARFGRTKREQLAQAVDTLRNVGATLLGTVLTMTPQRKMSNDDTYSYYGDRKAN